MLDWQWQSVSVWVWVWETGEWFCCWFLFSLSLSIYSLSYFPTHIYIQLILKLFVCAFFSWFHFVFITSNSSLHCFISIVDYYTFVFEVCSPFCFNFVCDISPIADHTWFSTISTLFSVQNAVLYVSRFHCAFRLNFCAFASHSLIHPAISSKITAHQYLSMQARNKHTNRTVSLCSGFFFLRSFIRCVERWARASFILSAIQQEEFNRQFKTV